MLRLDFYESSVGETIVITFPGGGVGVIDANPSSFPRRQNILGLIHNKQIHFVCLTHPHVDHAGDLLTVVKNTQKTTEFWHTIPDTREFFYSVREFDNFPSPVMEVAKLIQETAANLFIDLIGEVAEKGLKVKKLHSGLREVVVDDVEIYFLSPTEAMVREFLRRDKDWLEKTIKTNPDPNLLSAVLVLKYGEATILLCGDAIKANWATAVPLYKELDLPVAGLIKIPHHGASNALVVHPHKKQFSYLDICSKTPPANAVLFAGSSKHPDGEVFAKLRGCATLFCLANGKKSVAATENPLGFTLPGTFAVKSSSVCNDVVSFEVNKDGGIHVVSGSCPGC